MQFTKATKSSVKLRLALFGPSGSGKTYTSLRMATGLGGKIAVIDTERGSASKYADRFTFDVLELPTRTVDTYVEAIAAAETAGYEVLIIDSLSHAWQELLVEIDRLAKAKYRGNSWSAWSEGTPKQRLLVDAILGFDGHVLGTMRSKTEWTTETENGKNRPVRVGLAPEQGKGIEYEFDMLIELSTDHIANVIKDRTGKFQDRLIDKPGEAFGEELAAWLSDGVEPEKTTTPKEEPDKRGWDNWGDEAQNGFKTATKGYGITAAILHAALGIDTMSKFPGTTNHGAICLHIADYAIRQCNLSTADLRDALSLKEGETLTSVVCGRSALTENGAKGLITAYLPE